MEILPDIDEGVFIYERLGKCVLKKPEQWKTLPRDDIITFDAAKDTDELMKNFKIGDDVEESVKVQVIDIIKKYWDSFCSEGCRRPILGYEFSINTGNHPPVCKYNQHNSRHQNFSNCQVYQICQYYQYILHCYQHYQYYQFYQRYLYHTIQSFLY